MRAEEDQRRRHVRIAATAAWLLIFCAAGVVAQEPEQKPPESIQTYYLKNATGTNAANEIQTMLRNLFPHARIYYAAEVNALSIRGSAEDLAAAQKVLADIDRPQKTYRVTYAISEGDGGQAQHFVLIVTPGNKTFSKQGTRVPIVTGQHKDGDDTDTEIQYQDVGINLEASLSGYGDGMRLRSKIEETSVADEKSTVGIQDPILKQSVLEAQSAFVPGKPLTLTGVDRPGGRHMQVQVTVEQVQ